MLSSPEESRSAHGRGLEGNKCEGDITGGGLLIHPGGKNLLTEVDHLNLESVGCSSSLSSKHLFREKT